MTTTSLDIIKAGEPVSAGVTNRAVLELERLVKQLQERIKSLSYKKSENGLYLYDRLISDNINVGDFVFFNIASNKFEAAISGITTDSLGNYITVGSTLVVGFVTEKIGSRATILIDGVQLLSNTMMENMVEPNQKYEANNVYYLSAIFPGKITKEEPALPIQVGIAGTDYFILKTDYTSPNAFEKAAKASFGCRPVGGIRVDGTDVNIVAFDGLEFDSTDWVFTTDSNVVTFQENGYMAADFTAYQEIEKPIWCMVYVAATTGSITVRTANSLHGLTPSSSLGNLKTQAQVTSDFPTITVYDVIEEITSLTALSSNASTIRTVDIKNANLTIVGQLRFKFTDDDVSRERLVIFKLPKSFQGWKMLEPINSSHFINDFEDDYFSTGTPQKPQSGLASYYYNNKTDYNFSLNWPSEPLSKTTLLINGVEEVLSEMIEDDSNSLFKDAEFFKIGISKQTLFWISNVDTETPWNTNYIQLELNAASTENLNNRLVFLGGSNIWYWWENFSDNKTLINSGIVYSNKLLNFFKEDLVNSITVQEPLSIKKSDTGTEIGSNVSATGNLTIYITSNNEFYSKLENIDFCIVRDNTDPITLFTNSTGYDIMLSLMTTHVKVQTTSVSEDNELYVQTEEDTALIALELDDNISDRVVLADTRLGIIYSHSFKNFVFDAPALLIRNGETLYLKIKESSHNQIQIQPTDVILRGFKL